MKICILGKDSYIGTNVEKNLKSHGFEIEFIDSYGDGWKNVDYGMYDAAICPIGIAHVSTDPSMESMYYAVNRDLPVNIAKKAKKDGLKQFIFFSSMIVYGKDFQIGEIYRIDENSPTNPENFYGKSKLEAEFLLNELKDENFTVTLLRLPMVYGPNCKGNFPKLLKIARKSPICPNIYNQRSMIYIDNLCEYVYLKILENKSGLFFPQNEDYLSTVDIIRTASKYFNRKIIFTKFFNPFIKLLSKKFGIINRVFGTKIYEKGLSPNCEKYNIISFDNSIKSCVEAYKKENK